MPWWAWLLVDLVIVLAAIAVVARAYWRGWLAVRAFSRNVSAVIATAPKARDVTAPKARDVTAPKVRR